MYRQRKREQILAYNRQYKAAGKDGTITKMTPWGNGRVRFTIAGKCRRCGTDRTLTVNHIKPVCVGGTDDLENLEILCRTCNIKEYNELVQKALRLYYETIQK